jgi:hypothetical protein
MKGLKGTGFGTIGTLYKNDEDHSVYVSKSIILKGLVITFTIKLGHEKDILFVRSNDYWNK